MADQLEIHTLNLKNGEAVLIVLKNDNGDYTGLAIIDAGEILEGGDLADYLEALGDPTFGYALLTHYHKDHFGGFTRLGTGGLSATVYCDPGGYDLGNYDPDKNSDDVKYTRLQPEIYNNLTGPTLGNIPADLESYLMNVKEGAKSYNLRRTDAFKSMPNDMMQPQPIGTLGNEPIQLYCFAGNGYTRTGGNAYLNQRKTNPYDANNFGLAWVLQCGQFRCLIAGDLGGNGGDSCRKYNNQETALATGLKQVLPAASPFTNRNISLQGHICCYKSNHHGSACSSQQTLLETMHPSCILTTARVFNSLPSETYCRNIKNYVKPTGNPLFLGFSRVRNNGNGNNALTYCRENFAGDNKYFYFNAETQVGYAYYKGTMLAITENELSGQYCTYSLYKTTPYAGSLMSTFLKRVNCHKTPIG